MKNIKAILGILLVFLLGAASGSFLTYSVECGRRQSLDRKSPQAKEDEIVRRLTKKLDLDSQQQEQVRAIVHEDYAAIRQIRRLSQPQVQARLEQGQGRINAILRPDQREKFQKIIAERKAQRPPDGP
ncbi:hypothetical protein [Geobacter sp. SVR]|uniref:hypothetical protein n=1 Tax=Geobacter sp. SVR TaxID=2495594 RepID=UPI00143EF8CD|nr:hypothetical protein [Geobacter sp. SVR]BCS52025.1 hypothetical protein GSVR_03330 [Geobacter sp. SVR]GCF87161.1 hypothetical protein GSbR_37610 [Geobacter sp. SVR]